MRACSLGFFNSASGGSALAGRSSGIGNIGVSSNPSFTNSSGFNSGFFNVGTAVSGLFSLRSLLPYRLSQG